jgi:predicted methyltransferase
MKRLRPYSARVAAGIAALVLSLSASAVAPDPALTAAVGDSSRSANYVARDAARHPVAELSFFGLRPNLTVVELWPGGGYWTEILGPYLAKGNGTYYAALEPSGEEGDQTNARWHARIAALKGQIGTVHETTLGPGHFEIAPAGSADLILTFRNLHNWMDGGYAEQALAACFGALKPGGILGIEEHRGRNDKPQDPKAADGYVREDYAIALIQKAGFVLAGKSEINANPKDTKDYPKGVWTLPPSLALGETDRAKYVAIGEADNFVLKFKKPN